MHWARLAPELSATVTMVRSWIMSLRPFDDFHEPPALVLRDRARLHEAHEVADLALVLLVVDLELAPPANVTAVRRVLHQALDGNDDGLLHAVAHHPADPDLPAIACRHRLRHAPSTSSTRGSSEAGDRARSAAANDYAFFSRSFSPSTVSRREISRRPSRILSGLSSCFIEFRKRRLNSSSRSSEIRVRISSGVWSRIASTFTRLPTSLPSQLAPAHEARPHRQLGSAELHGFLREGPRDAFELEHDSAGLDHGDPLLGGALALAHSGLCRLLRDRFVREHPDPHLAAALDAARDRHARRLDLAARDPRRLERQEPELAEGHLAAAVRLAAHAAALLLSVLDALRHHHGSVSPSAPARRSRARYGPPSPCPALRRGTSIPSHRTCRTA